MSFDGRWAGPGSDPGEVSGPGRGEKAVLAWYLDRYRTTVELKCEGLTAEQLAARAVPPSSLSLLGMVRHLARVEHSWTRRVFEERPELPRLYRTEEEPDLDFDGAVPDDGMVAEAWDTWRDEVAHAREVYAGLDLRTPFVLRGTEVEARDIVVHLIAEYARHCGHIDLLRECIDGRTGV